MNKTFIISECGINANGNTIDAMRQIDLSKLAGASAVKFQIYDTDRLFAKDFKYYEDSKRGMFSHYQHIELADYAKIRAIEWFASPFHLDSVDLMESLGVRRYKIASRSVFDLSLLERVAKTNKPVIMSCGMGREEDITKAVDIFLSKEIPLTLLYCKCLYPAKKEDINLNEMIELGKRYRVPYGLSSHCPDIDIGLEAINMGASVLEYHTTLDRTQPGCDQSSSIEYPDLMKLVDRAKLCVVGSSLTYF